MSGTTDIPSTHTIETHQLGRASSIRRDRGTLACLWLGFFLLNVLQFLYLYYRQFIEADNFSAGIHQLNALYAPYLGAVIAYFFGAIEAKKVNARHRAPYRIALAGTFVWNLLITAALVRLVFQGAFVEATIADVRDIGGTFSWLVAPTIGFYFARDPSASPAPTAES